MARWEELVGDSSELIGAPEAQTRKTMATILRRPGQFGLPAWLKEESARGTPPPDRPSAPYFASGAASVPRREPVSLPEAVRVPEATEPVSPDLPAAVETVSP